VVPAGLSAEEEAILQRLLASVDADHFVPSDLPLLAAYAQAAAQHDHAVAMMRTEGAVSAVRSARGSSSRRRRCEP
jgi:hypothetical protein